MNKNSVARFCGFFAIVATIIATLLATLNVLFFYDADANYFKPNTLFPELATIWALLAFAAAIIFALIIPGEEIISKSPFGSDLLTALPATLGFGLGAVVMIIEFAKDLLTLIFITILCILLAATYILLSETSKAKAFLGFAPTIACALLVGVLYFDTSLEMNAPMKVFAQISLLAPMLYYTAEFRYLLGREIPRLYLSLALGSIALSSPSVLAVPVAFVTGALDNLGCLAAALIVAGTNVTILLRLKRYLKPIPAPENEKKETDAQ